MVCVVVRLLFVVNMIVVVEFIIVFGCGFS